MELPLVSIIIPLFNHELYINRCLDSILDDGYPNLEVLIIDDGSSDRSVEIVCSWMEEHGGAFITIELHTQENAGVTKTLNRLVEMANGEFVVPLASDDFLLPGGVAARLHALQDHPNWLAVFGDCIVVNDHGWKIAGSGLADLYGANKFALLHDRFRTFELIVRWSPPGPTFMARKVAYGTKDGVGKYDENLQVEDRDYYLRTLAREALGFLDRPVSAYRVHGNNTSIGFLGKSNPLIASDSAKVEYRSALMYRGINRAMLGIRYRRYKKKYARLVASNRSIWLYHFTQEVVLYAILKTVTFLHDLRLRFIRLCLLAE